MTTQQNTPPAQDTPPDTQAPVVDTPPPVEPVVVVAPPVERPVDVVARAVQAFVDARNLELAKRDEAQALNAEVAALTARRDTMILEAEAQAQACLQAAQDARGILDTFIANA